MGIISIKEEANEKTVLLKITPRLSKRNEEYFDYDIKAGYYSWSNSREAKSFRAFFAGKFPDKVRQDEHRYETLFLDELVMKNREDKFCGTLHNIRPVQVGDRVSIQIPLPVSAHSGSPVPRNGSIDILCREGHGKVQLAVLELKAPGGLKGSSNPNTQAFVYSTAIHYILTQCDEVGQLLWKACGFRRSVPTSPIIKSISAIHISDLEKSEKQRRKLLDNLGDCSVKPHFMAYEMPSDENRIIIKEKSF